MAPKSLSHLALVKLGDKRVFGLDQQQQRLRDLVNRLVHRRESGSLLLLGASGSGKSLLVRSVLDDFCELVHCVTLQGQVEGDNNAHAIKSICRQMRVQQNEQSDSKNFTSFSEQLAYLFDKILSPSSSSRPLVFVLENFEAFCSTPKQTLLYHLMNSTHLGEESVPVLVVGMTSRVDVIESLEKRVKSRFSHTIIHVDRPNNYSEHLKAFQHLLRMEEDDKESRRWNGRLDELINDKKVKQLLEDVCDIDPSVATLRQIVHVALVTNDAPMFPPSVRSLESAWGLLNVNVVDVHLRGLSVLEMTLLITITNILKLDDDQEQTVNFAQVFHEYRRFAQIKCSAILTRSKPLLLRSWEHLVKLSILHPIERGGGHKVLKEFRPYRLTVLVEDVERVALSLKQLPTDVKEWVKAGIIK